MRDNPLAQWLIGGFSVLAFLVLVKYGMAFLPQDGFLGAIRRVFSLGS